MSHASMVSNSSCAGRRSKRARKNARRRHRPTVGRHHSARYPSAYRSCLGHAGRMHCEARPSAGSAVCRAQQGWHWLRPWMHRISAHPACARIADQPQSIRRGNIKCPRGSPRTAGTIGIKTGMRLSRKRRRHRRAAPHPEHCRTPRPSSVPGSAARWSPGPHSTPRACDEARAWPQTFARRRLDVDCRPVPAGKNDPHCVAERATRRLCPVRISGVPAPA
jgi:hypothetical protein